MTQQHSMNDKFRDALARYNDGSSLSGMDLNVLHDHFYSLSELVKVNPELNAIRFYAYMNLNRINDYISARNKK